MAVKYSPGYVPHTAGELMRQFLQDELYRLQNSLDTVWDVESLAGRPVTKPREGMVRYFGEDATEAQYYGAGHYGFTLNDSTPATGWWLPLFPVPANYSHTDFIVPQTLTGSWATLASGQIDVREGYMGRLLAHITAEAATAASFDAQYRFNVNGVPSSHVHRFTHFDPGASVSVATLGLEDDYPRVAYGSGGTTTLTVLVEGMTSGNADVIFGILDLFEKL